MGLSITSSGRLAFLFFCRYLLAFYYIFIVPVSSDWILHVRHISHIQSVRRFRVSTWESFSWGRSQTEKPHEHRSDYKWLLGTDNWNSRWTSLRDASSLISCFVCTLSHSRSGNTSSSLEVPKTKIWHRFQELNWKLLIVNFAILR
jgi:hypothetical protein